MCACNRKQNRESECLRVCELVSRLLTESIDVGVVDLGAEKALGGNHGVVFRQEELKVEETALVGGVCGTSNLHEEVSAVSLGGLRVDAHDYISLQLERLVKIDNSIFSISL